MKLNNIKISKVASGYYIRIPTSLVKYGILDIEKKYDIILKEHKNNIKDVDVDNYDEVDVNDNNIG